MDNENQLGDTNIFRITKDASGAPVYTHNNEVVPKDVFDQRNAQSTVERKEMLKPDAFDSQFDDMRAKTLALKRPLKKAKGGSINLKDCKVSTHQKNSKHSSW
tara:strand:+ start:1336 stop:1644 length:309 start_codon:yes stop_codon:yes gene_type:complete